MTREFLIIHAHNSEMDFLEAELGKLDAKGWHVESMTGEEELYVLLSRLKEEG